MHSSLLHLTMPCSELVELKISRWSQSLLLTCTLTVAANHPFPLWVWRKNKQWSKRRMTYWYSPPHSILWRTPFLGKWMIMITPINPLSCLSIEINLRGLPGWCLSVCLCRRSEKTFMKLIVDVETDQVIGAAIVGPDAAETIQAVAIAVKCGATKSQFDATVSWCPASILRYHWMSLVGSSIFRAKLPKFSKMTFFYFRMNKTQSKCYFVTPTIGFRVRLPFYSLWNICPVNSSSFVRL